MSRTAPYCTEKNSAKINRKLKINNYNTIVCYIYIETYAIVSFFKSANSKYLRKYLIGF